MNKEKGVQIKKVRLYARTITNPLILKKQQFLSESEHKRNYYVDNESNYAMGIYEGPDSRGKVKRHFKLISNLEAVRAAKTGAALFPERDKDKRLLFVLKGGTQVLFYENSRSELIHADKAELAKRLYKVVGLSISRVNQYEFGMVNFRHNQEARSSSEIKGRKGVWRANEEYRPVMTMSHNQLNIMVEGVDFTISITGEIKFIAND